MIICGLIVFNKELADNELDARVLALAFQNSINIGGYDSSYDKQCDRPDIQEKLKSTELYRRFISEDRETPVRPPECVGIVCGDCERDEPCDYEDVQEDDSSFSMLTHHVGWWCCSPMGIGWKRQCMNPLNEKSDLGEAGDAAILTREEYDKLIVERSKNGLPVIVDLNDHEFSEECIGTKWVVPGAFHC